MKRWSAGRLIRWVVLGLLLWAAVAGGCLMVGSSGIGWPGSAVLRLRMQYTLTASVVGAALACAGIAYQLVLRNPLAEPYLLGVSSGASLAVYLWSLLHFSWLVLFNQQLFAFGGAVATLAIVFILAQRRGRLDPISLLLVGVIVNAINGSIFLLIFHLSKSQDIAQAFRFLAGGLQMDLAWAQINLVAGCFATGWIILMYLGGQLGVGGLSEAEAEALGVRVQRLRWITLIVASLMTASAMAISGPIGFVGLVCPHVARLLVGSDSRKLIPISTILGACLLALADVASRRLNQLPVGVISGFLGGPFFLVLLWRTRRQGAR